ncbi:glutaminyl-peptide cyclotransferase [Salegentibacter sp. F188]|uniref:Glutaminyl-peptide cyclotransferase n=1 Tax=Autumnicola patrickiae TaxID=3075591 RepID=A0ABU3DXS7_9FLAO|nr:glutaminyl-peptide cyclotransferase [Salegentibacter sp. F188]MDT0688453.1 glutaminyl-peptide cyclotransferase [Salegentibacter sp. F188]
MNNFKLLTIFILTISLFSCGSNSDKKSSDFSLKTSGDKKEFQLGEEIQVSVLNPKNKEIDSVDFYFEGERLNVENGNFNTTIDLDHYKLGNQPIEAHIFTEGEKQEISKTIKLFNNSSPVSYTYEIVNSYPHDPEAYTQGLEFYKDTLYESIGQYGKSRLRKTNLETGEVYNEIKLDDQYFGEGLTILNGNLYQLTWREGEGLVYNLENFEQTGTFAYNESKEGWGLTNDGENLYKSDGTEKIWILDPETLAEKTFIQPAHHRGLSSKLNELEWVEGKIYANTYQKDGVAIINPENGAIEGLIDFRGLREKVTQHDKLDVLNGIAYNPNSKKLYVTGKNWDRIFEVKIIEK